MDVPKQQQLSSNSEHLVVYDGMPNLYDELQLVIAGLQMSLQCKDEHIAELEQLLHRQQQQQPVADEQHNSTCQHTPEETLSVPDTPAELCDTPRSCHVPPVDVGFLLQYDFAKPATHRMLFLVPTHRTRRMHKQLCNKT